MKVSLNTIKQFIDFELPAVDELVKRINEQLGGIEEVVDLADKYKDAVIVKVVECEKHPNADKLSVCKIDIGDYVPKSTIQHLDSNRLVTVVCGAPNVHADMLAVWLPPESVVPVSYGTTEPFVLNAREIRGIMSNGMLAAADELGIGNDHGGIVELSADENNPQNIEIAPGTSFAKAFGFDDTIIDIENKMFTHRPDLFGQLGIAREIAGILGKQFKSPDWYKVSPEFDRGEGRVLVVENNASEKVPRFMAIAIKDVEVKPSPMWLQCELVRLGGKPINNIVDITNYIMLLTAQPTHAYDYDKLRGHKLGVRMASEGETIHLLNNKTYTLSSDDIVIVDNEGPVGLAGIMGGSDSEVSADTKNIVLEVACFDMYAVRKTSMRHGLFTDALTRFNKGQSPLQQPYAMNLLMSSIKDVAGGEQASEVFGQSVDDTRAPVMIKAKFINDRLGLTLSDADMCRLLENVEIDVSSPDDHDTYMEIFPPFWRTDLEQPEDIVEEVGRVYGFDKLPLALPVRSIAATKSNQLHVLKQSVRECLSRAGASEVLTYSFVHENILKRAGQDPANAFRLSNALSPDLQYYRLSLVPSLLDKVHMNIKAGHSSFALFEIGKTHHKQEIDGENLPREFDRIAGVYANNKPIDGAPYFHVKAIVADLLKNLSITQYIEWRSLEHFDFGSHVQTRESALPFEPTRSSVIVVGNDIIGIVGELTVSTQRGFKLPANCAAFELSTSKLMKLAEETTYQPLSRFPSTSQDISLKAPSEVSYHTLFQVAWAALSEKADGLNISIEPVSIYQAADDIYHKTTSFHLTFTNFERTLTDEDIKPLMDHLASRTLVELGAERI